MKVLRAVAVPLLACWTVAAVLAGGWTLVAGGPFPGRLGLVAVVLGAVVLLSGGGAWMRRDDWDLGALPAADLAPGDRPAGRSSGTRLTGTGFGLLVGLPLILIGAALATL